MQRFYVLLCMCVLPLLSYSQITMTTDDRPPVNSVFTFSIDTTVANLDIGMAGEDQEWFFDSLEMQSTLQSVWIAPEDAPLADVFTDADIVLAQGGSFQYVDYTDDCDNVIGLGVDFAGDDNITAIPFDPAQKLAQYPFTYESMYTDSSAFSFTIDGTEAGFDSIRFDQFFYLEVVADAYGTVHLPDGEYEALRVQQTVSSIDSIYVLFNDEYSLFAQQANPATVSYYWVAKESKGILLQATTDATGDEALVFFTGFTAAPVAAFSFEDQTGGIIEFTDESVNDPTEWLWDFGDGSTSTLQDPTHTYTDEGMYTVCLTASNDLGSNTTCMTVDVMLVDIDDPIAEGVLRISPNPTPGSVTLEWTRANYPVAQLLLFNSIGQPILTRSLTDPTTRIDLTAYPTGMYAYRLINQDGQQISQGQLIRQ